MKFDARDFILFVLALSISACSFTSAAAFASDNSTSATQSKKIELTAKLIEAAEAGESAAVSSLLKSGADVNGTNDEGETAIWLAVYAGHETLALDLIKRGAKTDSILKKTSECLLHRAVLGRLVQLARVLAQRDPKCKTQRDFQGHTPLDLAKSMKPRNESLAHVLR
jgi:ankyrin repeat protein